MEYVLESVDPRGRIVTLTVRQWTVHILPEHDEMVGREAEINAALEHPDLIASDVDHVSRDSYYRRGPFGGRHPGVLLKVCVQWASLDDDGIVRGTVITAYPTRRVKQGERVVWPSENLTN